MGGGVSPSVRMERFNTRDDSAGLNTATGFGTENGNISQDVDTLFRLRVQFNDTASSTKTSNYTFGLEYQINGTGGFSAVTTGTPVQAANSAQFADDDAVTSAQLTAGAGSFVNGAADENGTAPSAGNITLGNGSGHTECEFCLTIDSAQVANNDSIEIRGTGTDAAAANTLTVTVIENTVFNENHSMTATGTSSLIKAITKDSFASTATGTSVLSKGLQFMQNQAMTATGTAVLSQTITYFQGLAHSATGTPVLSTIKSYVQALAHSAVGTSVLSSVKSFIRSFSQSATGTPSVSKETGKQPAHSATGSVATSLAVTYTTSLTYTATGTPVSEQTFVPDAGPSVIKKAIRTGMGFARRFSWRG